MPNNQNLLLITMDELHLEALSCHGATSHSTPNIDRLASESRWFTNAQTASPLCLPSRVSIATGLYPHSTKSISNLNGTSMDKKLDSLFSVLGSNGYRNSVAGKCHFVRVPYADVSGNLTKEYTHVRDYYTSLGIDRLYLNDGNAVSAWYYDDYARELDEAGLLDKYRDEVADRSNQGIFDFPGPDYMHPDCRVGSKAVEMIETSGRENEFLWVSFSGPHYPINTPTSYLERVDITKAIPRHTRDGEWEDTSKAHRESYHGGSFGADGCGYAKDRAQKSFDEVYWDRWRLRYFANVVLLDDQIGKILTAAKERWGDNFITVFTADHGDLAGNHSLWGKNGAVYEDVLRVPLMIRDVGGGRHERIDTRVSTLDIFPTCMKMLGLPIPECEGISLVGKTVERDILLSEADYCFSMNKGRFKLAILDYQPYGAREAYTELYDLENDPHEFVNLAIDPNNKDILDDMLREYAKIYEKYNYDGTIFLKGGVRPYWYAK